MSLSSVTRLCTTVQALVYVTWQAHVSHRSSSQTFWSTVPDTARHTHPFEELVGPMALSSNFPLWPVLLSECQNIV